MAWHADLVESVTTLLSEITAPSEPADLYVSRGSSIEEPGWTVLESGQDGAHQAHPDGADDPRWPR